MDGLSVTAAYRLAVTALPGGFALLAIMAVMLRLSAGALRSARGWPVRLLGSVLAAIAAWMVAGAAGAWFPLWPVLIVALVAATATVWLKHGAVPIAADVLVVLLACLLSIPPVPLLRLGLAAAAAAALGLTADLGLDHSPRALVPGMHVAASLVGAGAVLVLGLALAQPWSERPNPSAIELISLRSGLTPAVMAQTERIVLSNGSVAWLNRPAGDGPFPGALFFHGRDPQGSKQPAALIARRALLDAGFVVLAIDHPSFGESPHPKPGAPVAAWDPLPTARAAFDALQARPDVTDAIIAVGHSMGAEDVMRLISDGAALDRALLFGGAADEFGREHPEDYETFVRRRRIVGQLPRRLFEQIRACYYHKALTAALMPPSHPPITFVDFGIDWPDVVAKRDRLYAVIPGQKTRRMLEISTHYFSAAHARDLLIGDVRVTRRLRDIFRAARAAVAGPASSRIAGR